MTIRVPHELQWVLVLTGAGSLPEADEDRMLRAAAAFSAAEDELRRHAQDFRRSTEGIRRGGEGSAVSAATEELHRVEAVIDDPVRFCQAAAALCNETARDVRHTKLLVLATLTALAVQLAGSVLFAPAGGSVLARVAQLSARSAIRRLLAGLALRLLQRGAVPAVRGLVPTMLRAGLIGELWAGGIEMSVQGIETLSGERDEIDWERLAGAAVSGAAGGAAGVGAGRLLSLGYGRVFGGVMPGRITRGVTMALGGGVGGLGSAAVMELLHTGQIGNVATLRDGFISGLAGGAMSAGSRRPGSALKVSLPHQEMAGPTAGRATESLAADAPPSTRNESSQADLSQPAVDPGAARPLSPAELAWRQTMETYDGLGDEPLRVNIGENDAAFAAAHTGERHGSDVPLYRVDAAPGDRTIEGRIYGDPPWGNQQNWSYRWLDDSTMNRTVNGYLETNWATVRSDLALDGRHKAIFDAGNVVGEGFYNKGMGGAGPRVAHYTRTSFVSIALELVPGHPPTFVVITTFPSGLI